MARNPYRSGAGTSYNEQDSTRQWCNASPFYNAFAGQQISE